MDEYSRIKKNVARYFKMSVEDFEGVIAEIVSLTRYDEAQILDYMHNTIRRDGLPVTWQTINSSITMSDVKGLEEIKSHGRKK